MRMVLLGVVLGAVCGVAACGGQAAMSEPDEGASPRDVETTNNEGTPANGGTTPDDPDGTGVPATPAAILDDVCERYVASLQPDKPCVGDPPPDIPRWLEGVKTNCEQRVSIVPEQCEQALVDMVECWKDEVAACSFTLCDDAMLQYAECVSGGACHSVGGGSTLSASPEHPLDLFVDHDACRCQDMWEAGTAGEPCNTWEDCTPVCCGCPTPGTAYNAAVCDKSASGGTGVGRCASAETACGATADECDYQQKRRYTNL